MRGPSLRIACDVLKCMIDFGVKLFSGDGAAFKVPIKCRLILDRSSFKKFSWFTDHGRAWQQPDAVLHPRGWSWPCQNQALQCAELFHHPRRLEPPPRLPLPDYRSEIPQVWRAHWQAALGLFSADHRLLESR